MAEAIFQRQVKPPSMRTWPSDAQAHQRTQDSLEEHELLCEKKTHICAVDHLGVLTSEVRDRAGDFIHLAEATRGDGGHVLFDQQKQKA